MARRSKKNPIVGYVKAAAAHRKHPIVVGLFQYVAPALGGYVAVHTVGRIARGLAAKRWPQYATYVACGTKLATAGLIYYASGKVAFMKQHREAILAGVGVAIFESLLRNLLPGMAWAIDGPAPPAQLAAGDDDDDELNDADATDGLDDDDLGGGSLDSGF